MSISASIGLRIVNSSSGSVVLPTEIIKILINNEWNLINHDGYAMYLDIGDDDMFDWQSSKMDIVSLMEILTKKEHLGELIGVSMYWQNTHIGGSVLLWSNKEALEKGIHTPVSFSLSSDRKILKHNDTSKITDVNWYLTKLLPIFDQKNFFVEYFTYEEHI